MICEDSLYARIGVDEDYPERLYFCSADKNNGYKLTCASNTKKRYQCYFGSNITYKNPTGFVGEYNLEYDAVQGALYISKTNKKEVK